jgi:hypothetical protein
MRTSIIKESMAVSIVQTVPIPTTLFQPIATTAQLLLDFNSSTHPQHPKTLVAIHHQSLMGSKL